MLLYTVHGSHNSEYHDDDAHKYWTGDCPEKLGIKVGEIREAHSKVGVEECEREEDNCEGSEHQIDLACTPDLLASSTAMFCCLVAMFR